MTDLDMYCTQCGSKLDPGASFCSACGANVLDMENDARQSQYPADVPANSGRLRIVGILTAVWGVLALVLGAAFAIGADSLVDFYIEQAKSLDIDTSGINVTALKDQLFLEGVFLALSGAAGCAAAFMVLKRTHFAFALATMIASSLLSWPLFITLVVGLVMTYFVWKYKASFTSRGPRQRRRIPRHRQKDSLNITSEALCRLKRYKWAIFITMLIAYFFVYFQRTSVSVVGSDIVDELGGDMGTLSSVYFWTYTAMQIPSGLVADRYGPRAAGATFMTIAAAGSLITFAADGFAAVVLGKILIAVGMAVVYIPLMKLVSVWFPKSDFAVMTGITIAVGNVGAIAASGPLDMLADAIGWRDVFLFLGIVTLALAALCAVVVRDHPSQKGLPSSEEAEQAKKGTEIEESSSARIPMLRGLRITFSGGRKFWTCAMGYFLVYGTIMVFQGTWAAKYFNSVYGGFEATLLGCTLSAAWLITAIGIGKIVSTVLLGALTSRGMIASKRKVMVLGTGCFACVWAVIFLLAGDTGSYWFWFTVSFFFGFFGGFMSLSFAQAKEWYPIAISATVVSGMNVFLFLGASVCTTLSKFVIGTDYSLDNFQLVWGVMLACAVAAFVMMILSEEREKGDPLIGAEFVEGMGAAPEEA